MLHVTRDIAVDEKEIQEAFVRSPGPGGQHVNKASTAVQLRFDAAASPSLPPSVRKRLLRIAGNRVTEQGEIVIQASRFRSRELNRQDARRRLAEWIRRAAERPKIRRPTQPTAGSRNRRMQLKRQRAQLKRARQKPGMEE